MFFDKNYNTQNIFLYPTYTPIAINLTYLPIQFHKVSFKLVQEIVSIEMYRFHPFLVPKHIIFSERCPPIFVNISHTHKVSRRDGDSQIRYMEPRKWQGGLHFNTARIGTMPRPNFCADLHVDQLHHHHQFLQLPNKSNF